MDKEYNECFEQALATIKLITKESREEQISRFNRDVYYHTVIKHIAEIYFLIKTNKAFQLEQEELLIKLKVLLL